MKKILLALTLFTNVCFSKESLLMQKGKEFSQTNPLRDAGKIMTEENLLVLCGHRYLVDCISKGSTQEALSVIASAQFDPNYQPYGFGATPLWYAADKNNFVVMKAILKRSKELNVQINPTAICRMNDLDTIDLALFHKNRAAVQLLLRHGAKPTKEHLANPFFTSCIQPSWIKRFFEFCKKTIL